VDIKMPEIKITDEEMDILLIVKKKQLSHREIEGFLKLFCFLLDKDFFTCRGGKKVALFDGSGVLRQIGTEQIGWKL
jgi:hypothetical protein